MEDHDIYISSSLDQHHSCVLKPPSTLNTNTHPNGYTYVQHIQQEWPHHRSQTITTGTLVHCIPTGSTQMASPSHLTGAWSANAVLLCTPPHVASRKMQRVHAVDITNFDPYILLSQSCCWRATPIVLGHRQLCTLAGDLYGLPWQ